VQKVFDVLMATAVPLAVVMMAYAEEIVVFTAGGDFREGGVALQLLAPYVFFSFANGVLWRVLISTSRDRLLFALSVLVLAANVALNLVFIPIYGFKAAAVISVVSEAMIAVPIVLSVRRLELLPNLRFAPALLAALAAMVAVVVFLPGPWALTALAAGLVYSFVLLALPGTARDVLVDDLLPALRR
jgi:O-antigen/teichoic acid export membrane protein